MRLFTIRTRLVLTVSVLFLLALLIGAAGLHGLRDVNGRTRTRWLAPYVLIGVRAA